MTEQKIFSSYLSRNKNWRKGLEDILVKIKKDLGENPCDLVMFYVSEYYDRFSPRDFVRTLSDLLPYRVAIGCNASGVLSGDLEVEFQGAVAVMAMHLPKVRLFPFFLPTEQIQSLGSGADLIQALDLFPTEEPKFFCLGEPSSCDVGRLLKAFNEGYRGLPVVGGLASGAMANVQNWISLNGLIYGEGAVGVAMTGQIEFETVVSPGCRPIGRPFVITRAEDSVLYELAGRAALEVLQQVVEELSPLDRSLVERSLSVGLAMNEQQSDFKRGDFLIRNIIGFDPESGSLSIGEHLKVGQTLQFQLRDAKTSDEDLRQLLKIPRRKFSDAPCGGILVSCCGRGENFYGESGHDARVVQQLRGPVPLVGFFANGEIGPVGSKGFVHGYTSSLVFLR